MAVRDWVVAAPVFDPAVCAATLSDIGPEALAPPFGHVSCAASFAGWLIALMVWLLPFAESARVWVIMIITYLVAIGGFRT